MTKETEYPETLEEMRRTHFKYPIVTLKWAKDVSKRIIALEERIKKLEAQKDE